PGSCCDCFRSWLWMSAGRFRLRYMDALESFSKLPRQRVERFGEAFAPSDQHIVMAGLEPVRTSAHHFAQAPLDPVAFRSVADLLGDGVSHTGHRIGNGSRLQ